jgi:hypothetical protein
LFVWDCTVETIALLARILHIMYSDDLSSDMISPNGIAEEARGKKG